MRDFDSYVWPASIVIACTAVLGFIVLSLYIFFGPRREVLLSHQRGKARIEPGFLLILIALSGFAGAVWSLPVFIINSSMMFQERTEAVQMTYGIELSREQYTSLEFPDDRPQGKHEYGSVDVTVNGEVQTVTLEFSDGEYLLVSADGQELPRKVAATPKPTLDFYAD